MRALALTHHGGPTALAVQEFPDPAPPGSGEILIRIRTAAINHLDLFLTEGIKGITVPFPHIVGTDGAGVVEAVGAGVSRFHPGDRVTINPGLSCGSCDACRSGEEPFCRNYRILGEHLPGTAAQLVRVPERNVAAIPDGMPWDVAAALPLSTLTAWRMVRTRAAVRPGEWVLIWGIGGGVAIAALQVARLAGARVIVTSSSDAKLERAVPLGATATFNHAEHSPDQVAAEVRRLTGVGVDVVVDSVGADTWNASLKALRPGGRLVTCGATTGPHVELDLRRLFWFQWSLLGSTMGTSVEFQAVMAEAGAGRLWPVVDSVVPLDRAAEAYARMARGEQFGKLVIEVAP